MCLIVSKIICLESKPKNLVNPWKLTFSVAVVGGALLVASKAKKNNIEQMASNQKKKKKRRKKKKKSQGRLDKHNFDWNCLIVS